jgi:hypothetical protein
VASSQNAGARDANGGSDAVARSHRQRRAGQREAERVGEPAVRRQRADRERSQREAESEQAVQRDQRGVALCGKQQCRQSVQRRAAEAEAKSEQGRAGAHRDVACVGWSAERGAERQLRCAKGEQAEDQQGAQAQPRRERRATECASDRQPNLRQEDRTVLRIGQAERTLEHRAARREADQSEAVH